MAFGKRTAGSAPPPYTPPAELDAPEAATPVRTRVTNPGAIDNKFIGLAVGVVFLSAGAAIAAPSLLSMVSGASVRPIEQVIAGLDRDAMRTALALEAFPDESGRAFMTSLATHFPQQHDRLLDQLADTAAAGGDRDDLFLSMNAWTMGFAPQHIGALGRTGAEGFDKSLGILKEALQMVESETGGCTMKSLEGFMLEPSRLTDLTRYGSAGYRVSMRAGATMVDLVAKGRNAPPVNATITLDDENALQSTFRSMMSDPQVMNLIQSGMNLGSEDMQMEFAQNINVCQFARTLVIKLENLPAGTKSRLLATVLSSDFGALAGNLGSPLGPGAFQDMQPGMGTTQFFP